MLRDIPTKSASLIGVRKMAFVRARQSKLQRRRNIEGYLFISPWILGFLIFTLGPIIASLLMSFTNWDVVTPPSWVGAANYKSMMSDELFRKALINTVYYTAFSVPLGMITALSLALLLNQKLKGTYIFRTIYYLPAVTSGVAVALLWRWIFNPEFGVANYILLKFGLPALGWLSDPKWAMPALIIMSIWGVGNGMLIYLAGLQGIPTELYEAAEIDGAGPRRKFWSITLPLLTPTIFFNMVMSIIGSFQVFTNAYVMTGGGPANATLFYVLYLYRNAFEWFKMGYASALAWVLFIIILIPTLLQFKFANKWVHYQ